MKSIVADYKGLGAALEDLCAFLEGLPEAVVFDSKLVAMELLSNVLQHGGGRATFSYVREGNEIKMSVRGERDFRPPEHPILVPQSAERGRGLYIVDRLVSRRFYSPEEGTVVILKVE